MSTPEESRVPKQEARPAKGSKIVRWSGIIIFAAVCVILAVFWRLFLNGLTRRAVEKTGTAVAGAEVDLDAARVSLSPLGITLTGLQVTDPGAPAFNVFEAGRIAFHMDGPNALRHKVIIEEMSVENVRLNSPRRKPGYVVKTEGPSLVQQIAELPSFVIPNVKEVFEQEKAGLPSLKLITGAVDDAGKAQVKWQARIKELKAAADPDKYQKQFEALKARKGKKASLGNILGGAQDVVALQKQVRQDLKTIASAKNEFTADAAAIRKVAVDAPALVEADARKLIDKYSFSQAGLANISRLLFGGRISGQVSSALEWNQRLAPIIDRVKTRIKGKEAAKPLRAKGLDVRFHEDHPLPDFLARLVKVSISLPAGDFAGRVENLTPDQDVLGQPLKFNFSGRNLKGLDSAVLEGTFSRVNPAAKKDSLDAHVRGYRAKDVALSTSRVLPVSLKDGLVDLDLGATVENGRVSARIKAGFRSVRLSVEKKEDRAGLAGRVDSAIRTALQSITSFHLSAEITGTSDALDIQVRSDLDDVLKNAVGAVVRDQMAGLERDLKAAISARVAEPLGKLGQGVRGLDASGLELDGLEKRLNDLLKKLK